jgi:hypothetical protein
LGAYVNRLRIRQASQATRPSLLSAFLQFRRGVEAGALRAGHLRPLEGATPEYTGEYAATTPETPHAVLYTVQVPVSRVLGTCFPGCSSEVTTGCLGRDAALLLAAPGGSCRSLLVAQVAPGRFLGCPACQPVTNQVTALCGAG